MKKNIFFKYLVLACAFAVVFAGCRKEPAADKVTTETLNAGKTLIGFPDGMESSTFFDPFTDVKTIDVFTLKKDAANNTDLKKAQNFVVSAVPDSIDAYNEANGTAYELLPSSFYTIGTSSTDVSVSGDNLTFKFASGDFAKNFVIKLDGSKLDLSKSYALAYKITDSAGVGIHAASRGAMYAFYSVKNKYDGVYTLGGTIARYIDGVADASLGGTYPDGLQVEVATIGTYTNSFSLLWITGGGVGGIAGLQLTVDPATNKVTVIATGNAAVQNTAGKDNYYDPDTKTFHLAFDWGANATNKRVFDGTLTYAGSR
jgi:hypothetical protein